MTELVKIRSGKWEMSGVVHAPAASPQKRVGVVLLHENFNTKFGTHRMFYQTGEALAAAGFYALRCDNRGMCDSPGINPLTFQDRVADAVAATEFFKSRISPGLGLLLGIVHGSCGGDACQRPDRTEHS